MHGNFKGSYIYGWQLGKEVSDCLAGGKFGELNLFEPLAKESLAN